MKRHEIPLKRVKAVLSPIALLPLIFSLGFWAVTITPAEAHSAGRSQLYVQGLGAILIGMGFLFSPFAISRLVSCWKPGVVLDEFGLTDNSTGWPVPTLRWSEISHLEVNGASMMDELWVILVDPERFIRSRSWPLSWALDSLRRFGARSPVSICVSNLSSVDMIALQLLIREYKNASLSVEPLPLGKS